MAPNDSYPERLTTQVQRLKNDGFIPMPCMPLGKIPDCGKGETWETAQEKQWKPNHNIGLWCKPNKIVVVDIDTIENTVPGSETDPTRLENALLNTFPEMRNIPQESTPSGGKHYFFKENEKSIKKCMTHALTINTDGKPVNLSVDIKAPGEDDKKGGFIVIAPSMYPLENNHQWKNKFGGKEYTEIIPIKSDNLIPMSDMMVTMFENHVVEYYYANDGTEKLRIIDENPTYQVTDNGMHATGNILRNKECCELVLSKIPKSVIDAGYDIWIKDAVIPIINAFSQGKQGNILPSDLFELMEKYLNPTGKHDKNQNIIKYTQILMENKNTKSLGSLMMLIKQDNITEFNKLVSAMRESKYMIVDKIKMEFTDIDQIRLIPEDASIETAKEFMSKTIRYASGAGNPYYLIRVKKDRNSREKEMKIQRNEKLTEDDYMFSWEPRDLDKFKNHVLMTKHAMYVKDGKVNKISYFEIFNNIKTPTLSVSNHENKPYTPLENRDNFDTKDTLNTFTGYVAKLLNLDEARKNKNVDLILNHIYTVWCNGDNVKFEYVINWLSHNLQKPREKPEYGLVLKDIYNGSGKSRIIELMIKYIYGGGGLIYNGLDEYLDERNTRKERGLLVFIDEVSKKLKDPEKLKRCQTNLDDTVRFLYNETREILNYNAFIFCTNNDHVLKSKSGDRRFFYLDVSNIMKGNHEYFTKFEQLTQYDWNCYYTVMMHRDLSKFNPRTAVMTEEKEDNIIANIDMATKYLVESLMSANKPAWLITEGGELKFHTQSMYNTMEGSSNFRKYCENYGIKNIPTKTGMETTLVRSLGKSNRLLINGVRLMGYKLSLDEIKLKMTNYHGDKIVERLFNDFTQ